MPFGLIGVSLLAFVMRIALSVAVVLLGEVLLITDNTMVLLRTLHFAIRVASMLRAELLADIMSWQAVGSNLCNLLLWYHPQ